MVCTIDIENSGQINGDLDISNTCGNGTTELVECTEDAECGVGRMCLRSVDNPIKYCRISCGSDGDCTGR